MVVGLSDADWKDIKFENAIKKGHVTKSKVKATKDLLKRTSGNGFQLTKACNDDGLPKKVKVFGLIVDL